jgi:2-hydroxy-6-oxonona-2,4-dienedioate hydrolase
VAAFGAERCSTGGFLRLRWGGDVHDERRYREVEERLWRYAGLTPDERRIQVAGVGVRVQSVGDGPPVVFIHGAPNGGSTWALLVAHLTGFRCHLVDRPGTGLSDDFVLVDDVHGFARRFLPEVLDALELDRVHVVASSLGGFLALLSTAAAPERTVRMVQIGSPTFVPGMWTPGLVKAMSLRPVRWLMDALPPNERVVRSILRHIGHGASLDAGRIPPIFFDWYLALQRYTNTMRNDGEMIGRAGSLRGFPPELTIRDDELRSVAAATLFLWGQDDLFDPPVVARHLVELMPRASLSLLPAAGHLPWLDDPEGIARATADFLSKSDCEIAFTLIGSAAT